VTPRQPLASREGNPSSRGTKSKAGGRKSKAGGRKCKARGSAIQAFLFRESRLFNGLRTLPRRSVKRRARARPRPSSRRWPKPVFEAQELRASRSLTHGPRLAAALWHGLSRSRFRRAISSPFPPSLWSMPRHRGEEGAEHIMHLENRKQKPRQKESNWRQLMRKTNIYACDSARTERACSKHLDGQEPGASGMMGVE
jgi:hypothetical protein